MPKDGVTNENVADSIPSIRPRHMVIATVVLFLGYQAFIFLIWHSFPEDQIFINRWSWSSADAMALAGLILTNYIYWKTWAMVSPEETVFMHQVVNAAKEAGLTPRMIKLYLIAQAGPRMKRLEERLERGEVTEEEVVEALK